MQHRTLLLGGAGALALLAALALLPHAHASAIIDNGVVQLGVDDYGQLNVPGPNSAGGVPTVGLRYMPTNAESTAPGCLCEGWGVSYDNAVDGFADNDSGGPNDCISLVSFTSTATTATSVVDVCDMRVTHDFHPSPATPNLYEVVVSITNTGSVAHGDVIYRRAMDWDVEPTPYNEYSTIDFVGPAPPIELLRSSDDGFTIPNPLVPMGMLQAYGPPTAPSFTDLGPDDHGAAFDFSFGSLLPGMTVRFSAFYGAAQDEATADAARVAAGVQLWSYGQCEKALDPACDEATGTPNTFIFGFGALTPSRCDQVAKTGRAYIAHLHNEDVGGTGYLGPADTWVVDSGDMFTYAPTVQDATMATYAGPLLSADVLFARTVAQPCASTARTAVAHLVSGPAAPIPFEAKVGEVVSTSDCRGHSGSTTLAYLMVNNVVLVDTTNQPPPNTKVLLGPVTVTLNEQRVSPGVLEVNAVHIEAPGVADLVLLSARSDIHGCGRSITEPCGPTVGVDGGLNPVLDLCQPLCDVQGPDGDALPGIKTPLVDGPVDPCCSQGVRPPTTGADVGGVTETPCPPCRLPLPSSTHAAAPPLAGSGTTVDLTCPCPIALGADVDPAMPGGDAWANLACSPCMLSAREHADGSVPTQPGAGTVVCDPCPYIPATVLWAASVSCNPCVAWFDHEEGVPTPARADAGFDCGPCKAAAAELAGAVDDRGVAVVKCDPCPYLPPKVAATVGCQPCTLLTGHDAFVSPPYADGYAVLDCHPCLVGARELADGTAPMQHGDGFLQCDPCALLPSTLAAMVPCNPCVVTWSHDELATPPRDRADVVVTCGPCTVGTGLTLDMLTLTEYAFGGLGCHGCLPPGVCVDCDASADEMGVDPSIPVGTATLGGGCSPCIGSPCTTPPCPPVTLSDPCGLGPLPPVPPPSTLPVVGPTLAPLDPVVQALLDALAL